MSTDPCAEASAWAEDDMVLPIASVTARRRPEAVALGRELFARAGGRPSIDAEAEPGQRARVRQVRVSARTDRGLQSVAEQQGRRVSAVMRDAVEEYLAAHG